MTDRRHATLEAMLKMVLGREAATAARHDDRIEELEAERNALAEENARLRKRVEAADSLARHLYTIGLTEGLDCETGPLLDAYRAATRKGDTP